MSQQESQGIVISISSFITIHDVNALLTIILQLPTEFNVSVLVCKFKSIDHVSFTKSDAETINTIDTNLTDETILLHKFGHLVLIAAAERAHLAATIWNKAAEKWAHNDTIASIKMGCPPDPIYCVRIASIIINSTSITDIMMTFLSELK